MAVSAEGFVGRPGERVRLTGPTADAWLHRQRAEVDAIAVGAETVLVDDPQLTARGAYRFRPLTRVIVDWRARIPATAAVYATLDAGPVIMAVSRSLAEVRAGRSTAVSDAIGRLEARGVTVLRLDDRDLGGLMRALGAREVVSLLLEGGPTLAAAFAASHLIDRMQWVVTRAEIRDGLPALTGALADVALHHPPRVVPLGDDVLLEFDVHRTD
jgi:diaminohydroxyphosphoribosylaminopyrimidine deaminase/5-amino-6-(5-phosphoribosylamino)uracil reductase